jgi:hypothetical protein
VRRGGGVLGKEASFLIRNMPVYEVIGSTQNINSNVCPLPETVIASQTISRHINTFPQCHTCALLIISTLP